MSKFWWTARTGYGDLGQAGDWIKDDGTVNTLPAEGDTVIFDGRGDDNGNIKNVSAGFDALYGRKFAQIIVLPSYTGNIGDSANFCGLSASEILFQGTGIFSLKLGKYSAGNYIDTVCDILAVDSEQGTLNFKSAANEDARHCEVTDFYVNAGLANLLLNGSVGADVHNLRVSGGTATVETEAFHYRRAYSATGRTVSNSGGYVRVSVVGDFSAYTGYWTYFRATGYIGDRYKIKAAGSNYVDLWCPYTTAPTDAVIYFGDTFMNLYQDGGVVVTNSPIGLCRRTDGECKIGMAGTYPTEAGCPHIFDFKQADGSFEWGANCDPASGVPKISELLIQGGELVATGKTTKMVGDRYGSNIWKVMRGASLDLDNASGMVIFGGSNVKLKSYGGSIVLPTGTVVSW